MRCPKRCGRAGFSPSRSQMRSRPKPTWIASWSVCRAEAGPYFRQCRPGRMSAPRSRWQTIQRGKHVASRARRTVARWSASGVASAQAAPRAISRLDQPLHRPANSAAQLPLDVGIERQHALGLCGADARTGCAERVGRRSNLVQGRGQLRAGQLAMQGAVGEQPRAVGVLGWRLGLCRSSSRDGSSIMAFSRTMHSLPVAQDGPSARLGAGSSRRLGPRRRQHDGHLGGRLFRCGSGDGRRLGIVLDGTVRAGAQGGRAGASQGHASGEKERGAQRRERRRAQIELGSVHDDNPQNSSGSSGTSV